MLVQQVYVVHLYSEQLMPITAGAGCLLNKGKFPMDLLNITDSAAGGICCSCFQVMCVLFDHADMVSDTEHHLSFSLYPISDVHETFRIPLYLILHSHSVVFILNMQRALKFLKKIT